MDKDRLKETIAWKREIETGMVIGLLLPSKREKNPNRQNSQGL